MKPPREWNEEYVLSLPLEDDSLERKGSKLLDLSLPGVTEDKVRDELAKQLSAFANTGGGRIIYGLSNDGRVDGGGVSQVVRGRQFTKEWLENVSPILTEFEIVGVNIYEIRRKDESSTIAEGKSLYVVDVPDSDRAPHQSKRDWKYYVRLGSASQPASHRLLEDIRNRLRHPSLALENTEIRQVGPQQQPGSPLVFLLWIRLATTIVNVGHIKASNVCVLLQPEDGHLAVHQRDFPGIAKSRPALQGGVFWEFAHPVYPEMKTPLDFECGVWAERRKVTLGSIFVRDTDVSLDDLALSWKIFADSAPPTSGTFKCGNLGLLEKALRALPPT